MSKLMSVLGIVLLAIGVALALVGFVSPDRIPSQLLLQGFLQTASTLIVGGILSLGLGGVIGALGHGRVMARDISEQSEAPAPIVVKAPSPEPEPAPAVAPTVPHGEEATTPSSRLRFPGFGRKSNEPVSTGAGAVGAALSPAVQETIDALEQAKTDLNKAMGRVDVPPAPEVEMVEEAAGEDLYVVEDKVIRGRPARILSDGTVEAETDEGWMRFENLDHLNEYLDSVQPE